MPVVSRLAPHLADAARRLRALAPSAPESPSGRVGATNWSGSVAFGHEHLAAPTSEEEIVHALALARRRGQGMRVIGGGHSFSPLVATGGTLLSLDRYQGLVHVDPASGLVTLRGGTRLHAIAPLLAAHGLMLETMGDIDHQSIAGAIQTGTHGTGRAFTGFAGTVRGLRIALADGSVLDVDAERDADLFQAARLGLGAFGVICEVTLQTVPAYRLAMVETTEPIDDVVAGFVRTSAQHDHQEFFWFPGTARATVRTSTRVGADAPVVRVPRPLELLQTEMLGNGAFGALCRAAAAVPALSGPVAEIASRGFTGPAVTDDAPRVYVAPRRVRFHESEWAIPAERFAEAFDALHHRLAADRVRVTFPLEIRRIGADDVWLSTAYGRDTVYIAAHRYRAEDPASYLRLVQEVLAPFAARPHWGKQHGLTAAQLRPLYPRFDDARAVRDQADPDGLFLTPYLRDLLGPARAGATPV